MTRTAHASASASASASAPARAPVIVLVHGAWHGAWCWAELQTELDRRGVPSYAVDLPGHGVSLDPFGGLHHDAAYLGRVLASLSRAEHNRQDGTPQRFILAGHSYGGAVITEAACEVAEAIKARRSIEGQTAPPFRDQPYFGIDHLVYIAAFALDKGESVTSLVQSLSEKADEGAVASSDAGPKGKEEDPVLLKKAVRPQEDGTSVLEPRWAKAALYGECEKAQAEAAVRRLCPQPYSTMGEAVSGNPRAAFPSTYIRCLRDRAVDPAHQAAMAARCNRAIDLDTDHSPFLSATSALADELASLVRNA